MYIIYNIKLTSHLTSPRTKRKRRCWSTRSTRPKTSLAKWRPRLCTAVSPLPTFHLTASESLLQDLKYVDRILNQNTYHKQYILYRNYPEVKFEKSVHDDEHGKRGPAAFRQRVNVKVEEEQEEKEETRQDPLNFLFKFSCDLTKDRTVSSADWNPINKDFLAVT